ncbi:hypothetical protein CUMW_117080 [Citrus unshiu]|nr:hypothetical protein CUMW_117080 [Citrus unshiu]
MSYSESPLIIKEREKNCLQNGYEDTGPLPIPSSFPFLNSIYLNKENAKLKPQNVNEKRKEDGDEDDETTEILLKFRDQIRNLLFKKTNESNEPEPGTLIWLLFNGMLCTV